MNSYLQPTTSARHAVQPLAAMPIITLPIILLAVLNLANLKLASPLVADEPSLSEIRHPQGVTFPPVKQSEIVQYTAHRASKNIQIDGRLTEPSWTTAKASSSFVDLVSGKPTLYDTRIKILWDDQYLYVGYEIEEPNVQAKFLKRDAPIWQDNDVELFIAFDHTYYELEINAHGTLYEGLFIWQKDYTQFAFDKLPSVSIHDPKIKHQPFNGVGYTKHPRGKRWAFLAWDFPGLLSAVHTDGTLNNEGDTDLGWTVELAIPWKGMKTLAHGDNRSIPPRDGNAWRMDFSRFNQYRAPSPARDSGGWALSHHGIWDSHIPEVFAKVTFSEKKVGE